MLLKIQCIKEKNGNQDRNVVFATINALQNMQTIEHVAAKRGKKVSEIL